ncbi:hypothetical protein GC176_27005 [bacterium]|nr:hypothetical protein [bacterium]
MSNSVVVESRIRRVALTLRFVGLLDSLAVVVAFLPWSLIEAAHAALGLGGMPRHATTEYLVRSVSLLHALLGALLVFLSYHVVRCAAVIRCLATLLSVLAALLVPVDVLSGMPLWWGVAQCGGLLAIGVFLLASLREVRSPEE